MSFSLFATPQQQHQPQPQQSPFQPQQTSLFLPQQQQQQFQPQQQQQPHQPQQQLFLFTNDKTPASYRTNWADLHPDSQKILLQIEERILEYRDESQRLDQCSRLYDSSVSNDGFELDAGHIVQELGGISTGMERQKTLLQELMSIVKEMLRNTEVAVRSFMILRPRFLHPSGGSSSATAPSQTPGATIAPGSSGQPINASIMPVFDFYSGLPKKPSPFLQQTILRFEKYLGECHQWIEELEQLLLLDSERNASSNGSSLLQSLPKVMTNVHDFFVHVAAKVESIHQFIESMKSSYLADQRHRGEVNDPFLEADRRETARQEAASKRVHPTLHLPANPQPSTQVAGLFSSSGTQAALPAPQTSAATTSLSSGSGFSLFSTPSSAPSSSALSSLFTTPTPAPGPQTSLFGSATSVPGQASTPSLFGNTTPLFSSTPATNSLFSTPFGSGAATGSGASFGPGSVK
ncbi:nuclear pore complex protein NUP58 isoform X2 [Vigna umbellata]|uniref:nuclear pore complex protein NUP58 isoform X2 n=1 Tax=Vigna umbellata TaxID=87088 RepID=UPI001F5E8C76|nr:nuclear pore complex protein NUP58 isoform X2 [Vigna umbellata]